MNCHATQVATWRLLGDRQLCAVLLQCELSKDGYSYRNKFLNWQWYFSLCGATITCGRLVRSCSISQLPQLRSFATPPHHHSRTPKVPARQYIRNPFLKARSRRLAVVGRKGGVQSLLSLPSFRPQCPSGVAHYSRHVLAPLSHAALATRHQASQAAAVAAEPSPSYGESSTRFSSSSPSSLPSAVILTLDCLHPQP